VLDTHYPADDVHAHRCRIESGNIAVGDEVVASVDAERRQAIMRSHTATHLLHHALRQVLGEHAVQSGSVVEPDRLRFDFSHYAAMSGEELRRVEDIVNHRVMAAAPVSAHVTGLEQAKAAGAMALFGEKYAEQVRMVEVGDFSRELCGGTHAHRTSDVGICVLLGESSVGAGLRRIEAVTGLGALAWVRQRDQALASAAEMLRARPEEVPERINHLLRDLREAEKRAREVHARSASGMLEDLVAAVRQVDDLRLIAEHVASLPPQALRDLADAAIAKLGTGVVVLATTDGDKVPIVAKASKDWVERGVHAGNLLREVARVTGGSGGGRPDFAQGGGRDARKIDQALASVEQLVRAQLGGRN
jgi:alanyl-tRNA synthetase